MGASAILFPGRGSQTEELRDDVAQVRPDLTLRGAELVGA
jgi:hypothetical protein